MVRRGMTERDRTGSAEGADQRADAPDLDGLARDWITLWQSELAALAHDREAAETMVRLAGLWAGVAAAWLRAAPPSADDAQWPRPAGAAAAAGSAPAAAAPDAGAAALRDVLGDLARRLDGIERRLAGLEGGGDRPDRGGAVPAKRGAKRGVARRGR